MENGIDGTSMLQFGFHQAMSQEPIILGPLRMIKIAQDKELFHFLNNTEPIYEQTTFFTYLICDTRPYNYTQLRVMGTQVLDVSGMEFIGEERNGFIDFNRVSLYFEEDDLSAALKGQNFEEQVVKFNFRIDPNGHSIYATNIRLL